jgi:opacity protein-like surface antigen
MKKTLLFSILVLAFGSATVFAETIYLKDGKILRGKIVREDDQTIMVETGDSWQKIDRSTVELIGKDDVQPVPPALPAAQSTASETSRRKSAGMYLGFQLPYNMIGGDFDGTTMPKVDSGIGVGFILGYSFNSQFGMEIDWAGSGHNSEGADIGFGEFSVNMKFSFLPEGSTRPFLFAGIGAFTLGDNSLMFGGTGYNLGLGVDFQVGETNTIGLALIRKIITYDSIEKSDVPLTLVGDLKGDTTSIRFDFTHHF